MRHTAVSFGGDAAQRVVPVGRGQTARHQYSSDGMLFGTNGGTITLAAGASATFKVSAVASKGAADGHKQANLRVSAGGTEVAHAMLYVLIGSGDAAPGRHMLPPPKA